MQRLIAWLRQLGGSSQHYPANHPANLGRIVTDQFTPFPEGAYLVGGAVRDALLGRTPTDSDWLVPDPEEAARRDAELLGGQAFVLDRARAYWRVVHAAGTRDYTPLPRGLEHDLARRDFTINAIALDRAGTLYDPCGGRQDLGSGVLRMISRENLEADPLRALRGARLATQLDMTISPDTRAAIREIAHAQHQGILLLPAWERVGDELEKILNHPSAPHGVDALRELTLLALYLPELAQTQGVEQGGFHHLDVFEHSVEALRQLQLGFPEADPALRWATLLHDVAKPACKSVDESGRFHHFYGHAQAGAELAKSILRRLRRSERAAERVGALVHYHMVQLPKNEKEARRFVHRRRDLLPELLKLMIADREAARGPLSSDKSRHAYRLALSRVLAILAEPPAAKPLLDGNEIMSLLGLEPGPRVGEALQLIQEAEAVGDIRSREEAIAVLEHYAKVQGWSA